MGCENAELEPPGAGPDAVKVPQTPPARAGMLGELGLSSEVLRVGSTPTTGVSKFCPLQPPSLPLTAPTLPRTALRPCLVLQPVHGVTSQTLSPPNRRVPVDPLCPRAPGLHQGS